MLAFNDNVPKSIQEKLKSVLAIQAKRSPSNRNPQVLLGVFQIALKYRSYTECPLSLWDKLRYIPANHSTKLKILILATKQFFTQDCDEAVEKLLSSQLPFSIIAQNIQAASNFLRTPDRTVTQEELEECLRLFNQIPAPTKEKLGFALNVFTLERRLEFLRELVKPENAEFLEIMAAISPVHATDGYKRYLSLIKSSDFFTLLSQIKPLLKDRDGPTQVLLIVRCCQMNPAQREGILKLCYEFFSDPKSKIIEAISELEDRPHEMAYQQLKLLRPLLAEEVDITNHTSFLANLDLVPPFKREKLVELIHSCQLKKHNANLLEALKTLELHESQDIVELLKTMSLEPDGYVWAKLVKIFCHIPRQSDRQAYINLYKKYYINETLLAFQHDLIKRFNLENENGIWGSLDVCLSKVPAENRGVVIELYKKHYPADQNPCFKTETLKRMCEYTLDVCENILKTHRFLHSVTKQNFYNFGLMVTYHRFCSFVRDSESKFKRLYQITKNESFLCLIMKDFEGIGHDKQLQVLATVEKFKKSGLFIFGEKSPFIFLKLAIKYSPKELYKIVSIAGHFYPKNADYCEDDIDLVAQIQEDPEEFLELIKPLRKDGGAKELINLIKSLKRHSNAILKDVIHLAYPFCETPKRRAELDPIFETITDCIYSHRTEVITTVLPYIQDHMSSEECRSLILEMTKYTQEERTEILELIKPILIDASDNVSLVLQNLCKHTIPSLKNLIRHIDDLRKGTCAGVSISQLFIKLSEIDSHFLESTIEKGNVVLKQHRRILHKAGVFPVVRQYTMEELLRVYELFPLFTDKITTSTQLEELLKQIARLPKEDVKAKMPLLKPLLDRLSKDRWPQALALFSNCKTEHLSRYVEDIQFFSAHDKEYYKILTYCTFYLELNESERIGIRDRLGTFLSQTMCPLPQDFKIVSKIAPNDWNRVYTLCAPLLEKIPFNIDLKIKILSLVSNYLPQEAKEIVEHTLSLNLNTDSVEVLGAIANTNRKDRPEVLELLRLLMPLKETEIAGTISILSRISPYERRSIVFDILRHLKNSISNSEIEKLLLTLRLISTEPRQKMLARLESLDKDWIDYPKNNLLLIWQSIPEDLWEESLAVIKRIKHYASNSNITQIVKLDQEDRESVLEAIETYCSYRPNDNGNKEEQFMFIETLISSQIGRQKNQVLSYVDRILENEKVSVSLRDTVFSYLCDIPIDVMDEILKSELWKTESTTDWQRGAIFARLAKFSAKERKQIYDIVNPILPLFSVGRQMSMCSFLAAFENMHPDQYAEFTHVVVTVYSGIPLNYLKMDRLKDILSAKQTGSPVWEALLLIIAKTKSWSDRFKALEVLLKAEKEHLVEIVAMALNYRPYITDGFLEIIEPLAKIPHQRSKKILEKALILTNYSPLGSEIANVINYIAPLPDDEIEELQKHVIPFCKQSCSDSMVKMILEIPRTVRSQTMDLIVNQPWGFPTFTLRLYLIKSVSKIVADQDVDILLKLMPLFNNLTSSKVSAIIKNLVDLTKENRQDLIDLIDRVMHSVPEYEPFVKVIFEQRNQKVVDALNAFSSLIQPKDNGTTRAELLTIALTIPTEEWEELASSTFALSCTCQESGRLLNPAGVLNNLSKIPRKERDEALKLAHAFRSQKGHNAVASFLGAIAKSKKEDRCEIINFVMKEFPSNEYDFCSLLETFHKYSSDERETLVKPILQHFIKNGFAHVATYLHYLTYFTPNERLEIVKLTLPLLSIYEINFLPFIHTLFLIAPEDREKATQYVTDLMLKKSSGDLLIEIFKEFDEIKQNSLERITHLLELHKEDEGVINSITQQIINLMNNYFLDQDHFLVQRTIELMTILNGKLDKLNPYKVYQTLKQMHAENNLLPFIPPAFAIDNARVSVNLKEWREHAEVRPFTIGDLPKGLPANNFEDLFNEYFNRIRKLPPLKQIRIRGFLQEKFGYTALRLKELFYKPYIKNLFKVAGPSDKVLEPPVFCIHAILKYICDLDNQVAPDALLSPREEALLTVCWSIRECENGQNDGIRSFFNYLPVKYRMWETKENSSAEQRLTNVVYTSVQSVLQQTFCDLQFLKLLDAEINTSQGSHITLYLMNLLFKQVGFKHRLAFDQHTGLVPESFLNITMADYLIKFFTICTPKRLIWRLLSDIKDFLAKKTIGYQDLAYTITHQGGKVEECIILDDDGFPIAVTEKGALLILLYNKALTKN